MFPPVRQRVLVLIGLFLAGAAYLLVARTAVAQGQTGLTLLTGATGWQPLWVAIGVSLPVLALAVVTGAGGNPLLGMFVVTGGLIVAAGAGGSMDGWLRSMASPAGMGWLAVETVVWAGLIGGGWWLINASRRRARRLLPGLLRGPWEPGRDEVAGWLTNPTSIGGGCVFLSIGAVFALQRTLVIDYVAILVVALVLVTAVWAGGLGVVRWRGGVVDMSAKLAELMSGWVVVAVGSGVLMILQRSADTGQVIGAMLVAFTAAGVLAHQVFTAKPRMVMLLGPLCVGAATYLWMAVSHESAEMVLLRYFAGYPKAQPPISVLPGLALALPVFYASAGVCGVVLGIGWSQSLHQAQENHMEAVGG